MNVRPSKFSFILSRCTDISLTGSANATEAVTISLIAPAAGATKAIGSFNPKFTYSIFGDDERIFGFKGLKINLRYLSYNMCPHVKVSYDKKFLSVGETEAADVDGILREHLPGVAFQSNKEFESRAQSQPDDFVPPGNLHSSFEGDDGTYEVWQGSLADPAVRQIVNRIEILVPMFIEGGSYIARDLENTEDPWKEPEDANRWTVYFLYRKQKSGETPEKPSYTFVGYSTVYKFFSFRPQPPASTEWDLPKEEFDLMKKLHCRSRLSQFLILPPFQGKGIGARLYSTIFKHYLDDPQTFELTVEDPNEAFDDMRDLCDLTFLRSLPEFKGIKINTSISLPNPPTGTVPKDLVDPELRDRLRQKTKIVERQFKRLVEMQTMSQLPESVKASLSEDKKPLPTKEDRHQYRLWRLFAKQRIYRQNADVLSQLDAAERADKLNEALRSVELEYARLLDWHSRWEKHQVGAVNSDFGSKRKSVDDGEEQGSAKKARVEDA
ncbi:histone acetyltransferase type b catalytic subunit [Colletotrichum karsti]|uniref:Histone acetyltransferase type B catalytic subunit n=1 Tax=Colletotrichum karsti TaxID=1095194 RepID=A0A9P6LGJ6_9PEZI|nr:histone acetyltransferase type b catalytic subunit [Colletotrichum karsti]KAF9871650.1 histone acetyltransferase type b catalytic subunit [Colletotrichum karsti]